jgi:hypothetical protein
VVGGDFEVNAELAAADGEVTGDYNRGACPCL